MIIPLNPSDDYTPQSHIYQSDCEPLNPVMYLLNPMTKLLHLIITAPNPMIQPQLTQFVGHRWMQYWAGMKFEYD
jgi:hypothetical protein